jgi:hypothetical protein
MDLDNFEFRPLTQGLGFDKTTEGAEKKSILPPQPQAKTEPVKKASFELPQQDFVIPNETPVSRSLKKMLDSLPPSVDFTDDTNRELKLKGPEIPRPNLKTPIYRPVTEIPSLTTQQNFDVTLNNSLSQAFPKVEVNKKFYHQMVTPVPQYKEVATSFASAVIDFAIVMGLASLFVVSLVAITQVDIIMMLTHSQLSFRTTLELALLYMGVTLFYFMLARGLCGSTLGDWAFDVQLGSEKERNHVMYPFQVLFRTAVIILTGIILIPVVSLGFGKDIAYYFSGLKLYSRQY